eukprot:782462-Pelagomonas_calceolata.AAC.1
MHAHTRVLTLEGGLEAYAHRMPCALPGMCVHSTGRPCARASSTSSTAWLQSCYAWRPSLWPAAAPTSP